MARSKSVFDQKTMFKMKRDVLLRAAAGCFNEKGFTGTSLKDVAKTLGLSDAALYYYVKDKEELVFLCYERSMDISDVATDRAEAEGTTGLEKLLKFVQYAIEVTNGDEGPIAVVSELAGLREEYREPLYQRALKHTRRVANFIEIGMKDGSIESCDSHLVSDAILGAMAWIPKWYRPKKNVTPQEVAQAFVRLFATGLTPR